MLWWEWSALIVPLGYSGRATKEFINGRKGIGMSAMRRVAALAAGGMALCAILLGGETATASATPLHDPHPGSVTPATVCGFNGAGILGQASYWNCSPYSVQIDISWPFWVSWDDTYQCVPANSYTVLNNYDSPAPYNAVFDGYVGC